MKLRMYEMALTQAGVSEILKTSPSLKVARNICRELNIDAGVAPGL